MSHDLEHLKHMRDVRPDGADKLAADWAVAEIERLRAERDQYLKHSIEYGNKSERLRAALVQIRYLEASDADTWIWQAQEFAREALGDEQTADQEEKA